MYESEYEKINEIVGMFLTKYGGLGNGYETYVSGEVGVCAGSNLQWSCPNIGRMTLDEVLGAGVGLNKELCKALSLDVNPSMRVKFEPEHMEHGCYDTNIIIYESEPFNRFKYL